MSTSSKKYDKDKAISSLIKTAQEVEKSIAKGVKPVEVKRGK
jgi:benzoyl-CoA reductase/2-hydroxyglutaryl-CoA dehydratase subunit BcrC/BadD/HgdB